MKVNKQIKTVLNQIAHETEEARKNPSGRERRQRVKTYLRLFKNHLTEEEQIVILDEILEQLSYRSVIVDESYMVSLGNAKMRELLAIFGIIVGTFLLWLISFSGYGDSTGAFESIFKLIRLLTSI